MGGASVSHLNIEFGHPTLIDGRQQIIA